MEKTKLLIEILQDDEANVSERDDAAMDLGDSDSPLAIQALVKKGQDREEDDIVLDSCGESLAEIWIRNNSFDQRLYDSLLPKARQGARNVIEVLGSVEEFIGRSSGIFSETCDFFASKIAPDYLHSAKKSQVSRKPPLNSLALNFSTEPKA